MTYMLVILHPFERTFTIWNRWSYWRTRINFSDI